jgi:DNA-binding MarR family transcriptional regulator
VDVSQQGVQILRSLALRGEQPIAGLARDAQMDISAVSRQLKVLEAARLVRRRREPTDARVVLIAATAAGRRVAGRVTGVLNRHLDDALASWSSSERRELGRLLGRLVHDLRGTEFRLVDRPPRPR